MQKIILVEGPCQTRSGYGDHTRDLIRSLLEIYPNDQIILAPTRWGDTPLTEWSGEDEESKKMQAMFYKGQQMPRKPDIFIQVSVPNEFRPMGTYNIGITAGIETTLCDRTWIEGLNKMDMIIVPSKHAKDVFMNTSWEQVNNQKQVEKIWKAEKPIEVLFEGLDTSKYFFIKPSELPKSEIKKTLDDIEEDFCFLFTGHWLKGGHGHDRKDVGGTIEHFIDAFKNQNPKPALVLKTSMAKFSIMDRNQLIARINEIKKKFTENDILPSVYLLHGDLTVEEMNEMYNHPKIKAMVSFTKGEGFGRPLLEFGVTKKPIIAPNWSGQIDFLSHDSAVLLPGKLQNVHGSASWDKVLLKESQWFYVDYEYAKNKMKDVYYKYGSYNQKARKQHNKTTKQFTLDKMTEKFKEILEKHVKEGPTNMPINLPKLKKVGDPGTPQAQPEIKLPKLKKV